LSSIELTITFGLKWAEVVTGKIGQPQELPQ